LILAYQGLEEESLDKKSPGPPGWGLMQQVSPLLIGKRKFLKSPLEIAPTFTPFVISQNV
jgi:hypothetical protein